MDSCMQCNCALAKTSYKYCSNKCQSDHNYKDYIASWKCGQKDGMRGINTKNMSGHIIRYLGDKYNNSCARCGWDRINSTTGNSPLEIDHMDGNSSNNSENNLILLCPNCHSLTSNYKNLNKGNGRLWRREKYAKIV